jgi:hypothetical protein
VVENGRKGCFLSEEQVVDLLGRVCAVSVETMRIVEQMRETQK